MTNIIKKIIVASSFLFPVIASAHVGYVIPESAFKFGGGADTTFLLSALKNPKNIFLIIVTIVGILLLFFVFHKVKFLKNEVRRIKYKAEGYTKFLPWMIRLALGITLIGAGTSGVLISPLLADGSLFKIIEFALGFMILSGFLIGPAVIMTIILYIMALSQSSYIFGNLDVLVLCLSALIMADGAPGVDDLVGIPFLPRFRSLKRYIGTIMRVGVGFALTYLALYEKIFNPHLSEMVVIKYDLTHAIAVSAPMWVLSVGIIELIVGACLIFGFLTRLVAIIAFLILTVTFFYFGEEVYSHVTLFTSLAVILVTGAGTFSIDRYIENSKTNRLEKSVSN